MEKRSWDVPAVDVGPPCWAQSIVPLPEGIAICWHLQLSATSGHSAESEATIIWLSEQKSLPTVKKQE